MQWNLEQARRENKLTQSDVAKLLGISELAYRRKEKGVTEFKMTEMFILSDRFKTPIESLFLRIDDTNRNIN